MSLVDENCVCGRSAVKLLPEKVKACPIAECLTIDISANVERYMKFIQSVKS